MPIVETKTTTYTCDRCKKVRTDRPFSDPNDTWGYLKIEQNSGFDVSGCPWAPRMREPLLLCGKCIEEIVGVINNDMSTRRRPAE